MKIYGIRNKSISNGMCLWKDLEDAIEEIRSHLSEGENGEVIEAIITEMSDEDYNKLPEFEGY